jgi:hypothetical protein
MSPKPELTQSPGIGNNRTEHLTKAGFTTIDDNFMDCVIQLFPSIH